MKDQIQLSDHFNYKRLIRFVIPSVVMMVFTSIYGVVDGVFVSNFAGTSEFDGTTAFAAIGIVYPLIMIFGGFGFMLGVGGNAVVGKTLGEGDRQRANEYFTFITIVTAIVGSTLALFGIVFAEPIVRLLGGEGLMFELGTKYIRIVLAATPFFMLQNSFQNFFVTAERPKLGLLVTVGAGVTNMLLDALFVAAFGMGIEGAALATAMSQVVGGLVPIVYFFSKKNSSLLRFTKTRAYWRMLLDACFNGSSELLSNISASVVTICFNDRLLLHAGEGGVTAYGVIMCASFVFVSIFIGFVIGSSPIVSFHFGAGNTDELKNIRKKSTVIVFAVGAAMLMISLLTCDPICRLFVGNDRELFEMTRFGFLINALSFLLAGFNIFGSSFFTALNNGLVSAVMSFLRTLVFQVGSVYLLSAIFELDGIWYSLIAAEVLSAIVTLIFLITKKKRYNY